VNPRRVAAPRREAATSKALAASTLETTGPKWQTRRPRSDDVSGAVCFRNTSDLWRLLHNTASAHSYTAVDRQGQRRPRTFKENILQHGDRR
jgi:hypothetical protein